jgi:hypothetical protein
VLIEQTWSVFGERQHRSTLESRIRALKINKKRFARELSDME